MVPTNEVEIISNLNKEIENLNKQLKDIKLLSDEYIGKNILLEKKLLEFENRESQNQLNLEILKSQYTKEKDSLESIIKSNFNPKTTSFIKDNSDSNYFKEVVKSAVKEQIKEIKIPKIRQQSPTCIIGLNRSLTNSNSNSSQTSTHRGSRNGSGVFKSAFKENKENKNDINRNLKIDCDNLTDFKRKNVKLSKFRYFSNFENLPE